MPSCIAVGAVGVLRADAVAWGVSQTCVSGWWPLRANECLCH
jgi:hypothetical protein